MTAVTNTETGTDNYNSRILIVDDTPENISLLTEMLQSQGYQILAANDGERALKIATHLVPDLILLDIMMPGMSGYETCQALKSQEQTRNIPVVFISARSEIEDMLMGFSVGGADYINKPFHEEEVYARIRSLLSVQRLNKQLLRSEAELKSVLQDYQQQADRMEKIVSHIDDGILEVDAQGQIEFVNPAVCKLFDYSIQELKGMNILQLLSEPFAGEYKNYLLEPDNKQAQQSHSILAKRKDGCEFPVDFSFIALPANEPRYLAFIHDISIHKNREKKLKDLSYHDSLTGLSNRRRFDEFFQKEWRRSQRSQKPLAFIMIDVDNFKLFNDTYGHKQGDDCLINIASTIKDTIKRPGDMVARLGGEEFVVLLPDTDREGVVQIAEQIRLAVEEQQIPHYSSEQGIVTISLGIAVSIDNNCSSTEQLYKNADQALYQSKKTGKNKYSVFKG